MCLVVIAWNCHPRYPLLIAANRDEEHARPSAAADWWDDAPGVYGGRDQVAGGSWLAVTRTGRYALVLNQPARPPTPAHTASRGQLVRAWVTGHGDLAQGYLQRVREREAAYAGFTLVVGTVGQRGPEAVVIPAGRDGGQWRLAEGITALSNSPRDEPLPKAAWLERQVQQLLADDDADPEQLFAPLARREPVVAGADAARIGRLRATPFLEGQIYGTRASTVVAFDHGGRCRVVERRFGPGGLLIGENRVEFAVESVVSGTVRTP
jgi:uncharacterized protein with NRDE domain